MQSPDFLDRLQQAGTHFDVLMLCHLADFIELGLEVCSLVVDVFQSIDLLDIRIQAGRQLLKNFRCLTKFLFERLRFLLHLLDHVVSHVLHYLFWQICCLLLQSINLNLEFPRLLSSLFFKHVTSLLLELAHLVPGLLVEASFQRNLSILSTMSPIAAEIVAFLEVLVGVYGDLALADIFI